MVSQDRLPEAPSWPGSPAGQPVSQRPRFALTVHHRALASNKARVSGDLASNGGQYVLHGGRNLWYARYREVPALMVWLHQSIICENFPRA